MAKATVTYTCASCGGTFEKSVIKRNRTVADQWEAWAAENIRECPQCYAARTRAEKLAEISSRAAGLPALQGTEKQVAWALQLRDDMIRRNHFARGLRAGQFRMPRSGRACTLADLKAALADPRAQNIAPARLAKMQAAVRLLEEQSAAWFINNRNL